MQRAVYYGLGRACRCCPKFQFTPPQQVEDQDLQKCKSIRQFTWFVHDGIADVGSHLGATVDIFSYLDNVDSEFKKLSVLEDEFETIDKHEIFTGPATTNFIHGNTGEAVKKASESIKPRGAKPVTSLAMKRTILKFFPFSVGLTSKTRKELLMLMFKYHYAKPVLKYTKEKGPLPGAYDKQHRLSAYVEILCGITEVAHTPFDSTQKEALIASLNEALKLQEAGGAEEGEGALVAKMGARVSPSLNKNIKESYYRWRKLA